MIMVAVEDKMGLVFMKPLKEEKEENRYAYDFLLSYIGFQCFPNWSLGLYGLDIVSFTYNVILVSFYAVRILVGCN